MSIVVADYEFAFYAVNDENKLVYGFDDDEEVKQFCKKHHFKKFTRNGLKNKKINPKNIDNWVFEEEVPKE